ncbi:hypothetical protein H114_00512 [Streptomyces gancidicus BKS 13-15]|uniref:PASTA domain-containing protein n=1 Tax=Streptomyces gancidicus BKS 13-15 TaxID=1284664 RepID=M3DM52_STREZ|nr:hypothetical protein [Streptomyces gancidicus]EMF31065.1 hypothetical protein H114_00512 [Streptomyces gancidicus BKS 13-15]
MITSTRGTAITRPTVTAPLRAFLAAVAVCAAAAACGTNVEPDRVTLPAESTPASDAARPVTAVMPDVVGGNALRAQEQMDGSQVRFEDATGKKREVVDPQAWRICDSRPGANQQITSYPVVLLVVPDTEPCPGGASG